MPKTFQNLGENDIVLPSYGPDPTGLASYRVLSDTLEIPVQSLLKDLVRVGRCGIDLRNDKCLKHTFWVNDASSRCWINVLLVNDNGKDPIPNPIEFEIRQSSS